MKRYQFVKRIVGLLEFCLAFSGLSLWAQFTSAIEGSVTDPSGAAVPNATVTVRNVDTGASRSLNTPTAGYCRFASLPAAMFTITVTAPGFNTLTQENIRLPVAEIKTVNLTSEIGVLCGATRSAMS